MSLSVTVALIFTPSLCATLLRGPIRPGEHDSGLSAVSLVGSTAVSAT